MRTQRSVAITSPNADAQPALHNCGPGPNAVYRTAPVGTVWLLDLVAELHASTLLPAPLRALFAPPGAQFDTPRRLTRIAPVPPRKPHDVIALVDALRSELPVPEAQDGPVTPRDHAMGEVARANAEEQALGGIQQLANRLAQLDRLVPLAGLVTWVPRSSLVTASSSNAHVGEPLPWMPPTCSRYAEVTRLAWLVCAFAYAAPPLVLFSRTPSLRYLVSGGALSVRWLGESGGRQ